MLIEISITEPDIYSTEPASLFEEEGSLWLWALPKLLLWDRPVRWLFSFVSSEKREGDLWGLDEAGNLLIVEAKRIPGERNPFRKLLHFESNPKRKSNSGQTARRWVSTATLGGRFEERA